jgi:CheY-like chemotaxis protein
MPTRPSILIADYDEDVLLRLEHLLETAGFDTTVTWCAREIQRLLQQRAYDLVVIGHYPPNIDAARILRQVTGETGPACIVLHHPERFPFDAEYFYSLGASAVLSRDRS